MEVDLPTLLRVVAQDVASEMEVTKKDLTQPDESDKVSVLHFQVRKISFFQNFIVHHLKAIYLGSFVDGCDWKYRVGNNLN